MQDDNLDDIIKEAADRHHPAYSDKAWEKMHELLDTHMPEKKEKRRFLALWLLLLLIGGAAGFGIWKLNSNGHSVAGAKAGVDKVNSVSKVNTVDKVNTVNSDDKVDGDDKVNSVSKVNEVNTVDKVNSVNADSNNIGKTNKVAQTNNLAAANNLSTNNKNLISADSNPLAINKTNRKKISSKTSGGHRITASNGSTNMADVDREKEMTDNSKNFQTDVDANNKTSIAVSPTLKKQDVVVAIKKDDSVATTVKINKTTNISKDSTAVTKTKNTKTSKKFTSRFGITASAGTDLSYVKIGNLGKNTFLYGAGLSYDISSKFRVRTGFYASSKIYSADKYQYHPPEYSMYYNDLTNIDADCRVYEIPLSLSYAFAKNKNHSFFTSAGLSSLIMKKESYDYYYKNAAGQSYYKNRTLENENKHLFSELGLSVGYQYSPKPWISLMAEPYLKMPLSGVGYGKIKLNSAGVMGTILIKPFAKK